MLNIDPVSIQKQMREYGINGVSRTFADMTNELIHTEGVAYQFILEELDAARSGNQESKYFAADSGIEEILYIGAMGNPFNAVDKARGPQQVLMELCLSFAPDMEMVAAVKIATVEKIMESWSIGKYAPLEVDNKINLLDIVINSMSLDSVGVRSFLHENPSFESKGPRVSGPIVINQDIYMISRDLGVEILFGPQDRAKTSATTIIPDSKRKCKNIWLHTQGNYGHNEYSGTLPLGFEISDTREQLIKKHAPKYTFKVGQGYVNINFPNPTDDRWEYGDIGISAHYDEENGGLIYFSIHKL